MMNVSVCLDSYRVGLISLCFIISLLVCATFSTRAQSANVIRLNQLGYYEKSPKEAAVVNTDQNKFYLKTRDRNEVVFSGTLEEPRTASYTDKKVRLANFSSFSKPGTYVLTLESGEISQPFEIRRQVYNDLAKASLKAFYYLRASMELKPAYAGKWARPAGHPDTKVLVHASAATAERPEGTILSCPRGWYDAGDYNKYIVNSGITMGTLLSLYEDFPDYCNALATNIPESNNEVPDLLDELLWNLRWMLTMQDPVDGGVYNKLTSSQFDGMVMPAASTAPRYVIQKSTPAALDFAAVTAQASRIFKKYEKQLPGLSDSCLRAATAAWKWAKKFPDQPYEQFKMNRTYDPDITTGGYGDRNFSDEFIWAASELYATTGNATTVDSLNFFPDENMPLPSWGQVRLLGYYTLLRLPSKSKALPAAVISKMRERILAKADELLTQSEGNLYKTPMGHSAPDFNWGGNSTAANQGILFVQAYRLTKNRAYLDGALRNLDYLLGKNGTGYSFVTGYGDRTPMFPHHRPSEADGIPDPIPGLLVGGPNAGRQDKCDYPSLVPDESYLDKVCSYASNEIAINWNAPFVYLSAALEALQVEAGYSSNRKK